ncbi:MAG: nucleotidyltransferase domain-containing protein, partial [Clostridia bacterium]
MHNIASIQRAVHQAAALYPVKRVELFGSYANGSAKVNSDVDFLVEFSESP